MTAILAFQNSIFVDRIATYSGNGRIPFIGSKVQALKSIKDDSVIEYYTGAGYGSEIDSIITCYREDKPFKKEIERNSEVFVMTDSGACSINVQKGEIPVIGLPINMPIISGDYWKYFNNILQLKQLGIITYADAPNAVLKWWLNDGRRVIDTDRNGLVDHICRHPDGTISVHQCSLHDMTTFAFDCYEDEVNLFSKNRIYKSSNKGQLFNLEITDK
jgi:hypothetical protein